MSACRLPPLLVLRVMNVFPQLQVTWISWYAGWMSLFTVSLSSWPRVNVAL